jgi:hypothetical protein
MTGQNRLQLSRPEPTSTDSACGHCDEVISHKPWCITRNLSVQYAYQAVANPAEMSPGDHLILHALGVAWTATKILSPRRK